MKYWRSEFVQNYKDAYSFGYCLYAQPEKPADLAEAYQNGYLPYSNAPDAQDVFYLCRSIRLDLKAFKPNSENRRVHAKFAGQLTATTITTKQLLADKDAMTLLQTYFDTVHPGVMPSSRLTHLLGHIVMRDATLYRDATTGDLLAVILNAGNKEFEHYWFAAYDTAKHKQSLGAWLMLDSILRAQDSGKTHMYLGTAYGEKALYKTNFDNVEWWAGNSWRAEKNNATLKTLMKRDASFSSPQASRWQLKRLRFPSNTSGEV